MIASRLSVPLLALGLASVAACGSDDPSGPSGSSSGSTPSGSDGDVTLAACDPTTTLIQTADWTTCLEGKSLSGKEPFNGQACELRFGAGGKIEFLRSGAVALSFADKAAWGTGPTGTYQHEGTGDRRIFVASISTSPPPVSGQPRITGISINVFGVAGQDDTVEMRYFDTALARQTYNCKVTVP